MNASIEGRGEHPIRRIALTALAGTSIEWYDFFLYGTAAALIFPTVFFPSDMPPLVALIASFSTFAVGFIARPIGGIVFGHFGDRAGRKKALVTALFLMGIATTLIGCLPTYAIVGPAAPLMLVALRFAQGLAIGGQWGGAVLLVTENAPAQRRGFYGSFAQVGAPLGVILANLAFLVCTFTLSTDDFMAWGWRIPFLLSVALIAVSAFVQHRLEDTPAFRDLERHQRVKKATQPATTKSPVLQAIATYPRQIALAAGAFLAVQVTFYILIAFVIAYGTDPGGLNLSRSTLLSAVLISAVVMIPMVLWAADYSDRHGRRGIYMTGAALLGVWAFVLFPLIETGSFLWITVGITVGQVLVSMMYGPQAAFLSELFGTQVRYSGVSLAYQSGAILGGALAPMIATTLLAQSGSTFAISIYIAIACAITIACVWGLEETHRVALHSVQPHDPGQPASDRGRESESSPRL
ncbi:metabolite-proton symporter [Povalibacter uvarum]|uniref:Metabolite-proton symporter n=1 Tax=Povalibacter uvarum TaxID=732238 RepID=A0A841HMA7_9GAMM|nr:MFS transporter [Povalibacter uvarum]MBB6093489.1 metabolite-proton symporter [Povalibacter uvarum]